MTWRKVRGAKKKDVELNPEKWVEIYEKKLEIYPAEKRAFQTGMKKRFCHVLKLLPRGTPHSVFLEIGDFLKGPSHSIWLAGAWGEKGEER